jgi:ribonuclease-3
VTEAELAQRLGYKFKDPAFLRAALLHASALPPGEVRTGEQLEFLGDAVLDLAISDLLLKMHPDFDEGELSKFRSALVCTSTLADKARSFGLGDAMILGRGEDRSGGRNKDSILAAAYESVIGAIFSDGGFHRSRAVIGRHFRSEVRDGGDLLARDWKTLLQERTQAASRTLPEYRVVGEEGPAHARLFTIEVWIGGVCVAAGSGPSKRGAEQSAARAALAESIGDDSEARPASGRSGF